MSDYQSCMTEKMRSFPKGISRTERGALFCIQAKICSGKAKTEDEAKKICDSQPPKEPKERKARRSKDCPPCNCKDEEKAQEPETLECPAAKERALKTIETIIDLVKEGKSESAKDKGKLLLKDVKQCFDDTEVPAMTLSALDGLKELGKDGGGYYYKGEISELKNQFDLVRKLMAS